MKGHYRVCIAIMYMLTIDAMHPGALPFYVKKKSEKRSQPKQPNNKPNTTHIAHDLDGESHIMGKASAQLLHMCTLIPQNERAKKEHVLTILSLLERGADIDTRDENMNTPLHFAALAKNEALTKLLLTRGADPNAQNNARATPLHIAAKKGHLQIVQLLLREKNIHSTLTNAWGKTAKQLANEHNHVRVFELIKAHQLGTILCLVQKKK